MIVTAKRVIAGSCLICGALAFAYMISSKVVPVRCRAELSRSNAEVGDKVRYSVNAVARRGVEINIPDMEKYLPEFSIIDKGTYVSRFMGKTRTARWYQLIQYKPGTYSIPPASISFTNADGSAGRVETGSVLLKVNSVLSDEEKQAHGITISDELQSRAGSGEGSVSARKMDDAPVRLSIADVKAPLDLLTLIDIGIMSASGILFISAVLFIAAIARKVRAKMAYVSPYETASAELKKIMLRDALLGAGLKEFYSKISRILRRYIGTVLGAGSIELTTSDLLVGIGSSGKFDEGFKEEAKELFLLCDLVKYSGYKSDKQAIEASLDTAKRLTEAIHKSEEAKEVKK